MKFLRWFFVLSVLILTGCSTINSKISASSDINPDIDGTPSPLAISIFELSDMVSFQGSDFYSLYSNARSSLGDTLLYEQNVVISPSETLSVSMPYVQGVHYVAYVAAFRNLDHVVWRGFVPVQAKSGFGQSINVELDNAGVHVKVLQNKDAS